MRSVLSLIHSKSLSLSDIAYLIKDFNNIKLNSDVFYNAIVSYIVAQNLIKNEKLDRNEESYFLVSVFILHGNLENEKYFEQIKGLIRENMYKYSPGELRRVMDIYKYSEKFKDIELKKMLEE